MGETMMLERRSGDQRMTDLGNEISDAIHKAQARGLGLDEACSIAVCVAADYWRATYEKPITVLADIMFARCADPVPPNIAAN